MTDAELEGAKLALDEQIEALRAQKRLLAAEQDRRLARATLERKLAALSDAERAALAQMVHAEGVPSGEAFGKL